MKTNVKFPWELLKAECLRLVCGQLIEASSEGQNFFKPVRKEDMVAFLHDVHERGGKQQRSHSSSVDRFDRCLLGQLLLFPLVLKALQDVEPPKKTNVLTPQATPSKRKSSVDGEEDADLENEEGYNTRYKGVKRVKVHGPSPEPQLSKPKRKVSRPIVSITSAVEGRKRGRPRNNVSSADETIKVSKRKGRRSLENGEAEGQVLPSISKSRGRPRKNVNRVLARKLRRSTDAPKSKDSARAVFDGILLVKRQNGKGKDDQGDHAGNVNGEVPTGNNGERDNSEEDAVVAAVNGDAQGDLSSLGGSNKGEAFIFHSHPYSDF